MEQVLELSVPFAEAGLAPGTRVAVAVHVLRLRGAGPHPGSGADVEVERLPRFGYVNLSVPDADFERLHWRV
jgi:hypothetical protein